MKSGYYTEAVDQILNEMPSSSKEVKVKFTNRQLKLLETILKDVNLSDYSYEDQQDIMSIKSLLFRMKWEGQLK